MAAVEMVSLVCDLHDGGERVAGTVPVWVGIGGQLYQADACSGCAARLREVLGEFLMRARRAGPVPGWLPRPDAPAGRAVGTAPKRDLVVNVVRARIMDGTYPSGSYLPTQRELAAEHGTSATPVHNACWQLEQDGLIRRTDDGRGYIVEAASRKRGGRSAGRRAGFPGVHA